MLKSDPSDVCIPVIAMAHLGEPPPAQQDASTRPGDTHRSIDAPSVFVPGAPPGTCEVCYNDPERPSGLNSCPGCLYKMCDECLKRSGTKCPQCRRAYASFNDQAAALMRSASGAAGSSGVQSENAASPRVRSAGRRSFALRTTQGDVRYLRAPARHHNNSRSRTPVREVVERDDAEAVEPSAESPMSQQALVPMTQGGGPLPRVVDQRLGFTYADETRRTADPQRIALDDPLTPLMARVRAASSLEQLRQVIHPEHLFDGVGTAEATRETTKQILRDMNASQRDYLAIGRDTNFSIHHLVPAPFRVAIQTVALHEGWPPEFLWLAICSNIGWLEHHGTRLKAHANEEHERTANYAIMVGGDPTIGKTSLERYTSRTLMQGPDIQENIRNGECICGNGTLLGHRTGIYSNNRSGIVTSEVSTAYQIGSSSDHSTRGLNFACREKVLGFVNCERDSSVTGNGPLHLEGYGFVHQVYGQIPATVRVLRPRGIAGALGFPKRFGIGFFCQAKRQPDQRCADSKALLAEFHNWMGINATPFQRRHYFDNYARSMFRSMQQGVGDFCDEAADINELFEQKLGFHDTDLSKLTNVNMRMCQYLESKAAFAQGYNAADRCEMSLYELAHAAAGWVRQLEWHHGLYIADLADEAAHGMRRCRPGQSGQPNLSNEAFCQRELLQDARCRGQVSTKDVRAWVRNKLTSRGVQDAKTCIANALQGLVDAGIVVEIAEDGRRRGRQTKKFQKQPWAQIENHQPARELLQQLSVSADHFIEADPISEEL